MEHEEMELAKNRVSRLEMLWLNKEFAGAETRSSQSTSIQKRLSVDMVDQDTTVLRKKRDSSAKTSSPALDLCFSYLYALLLGLVNEDSLAKKVSPALESPLLNFLEKVLYCLFPLFMDGF
ncbi:hypothetical protein L5515_019528 [Caenorhabditis briggsae]|uniref:Uncharacterized protein n=1 Tax=Caenorhabditis briggsae TaxID=6238 RepID=A0AAE9FJ67_CAEBR|nr:hypothetical protein L5515_019528 [Caenorhabditis briggsae]